MITVALPAAVPFSVGVVSSVVFPSVTGISTLPTLSVALIMTGAEGAKVSTVTSNELVLLVLPAASVALTVMVCVPSVSGAVGVNVQFPWALTTAVPNGCPSFSRVMVAPISPVPLKVGRLSLVVSPLLISPITGPTSSSTVSTVGVAGGVVSTVNEKTGEFADTLPAASLALILML
ncbi:hypothetical protein D3C78_505630 [compost metagenome]